MATNEGGDHWLHLGDGNTCEILDSREYIRPETGKKMVRFILRPSKRIKQTYDLEDELDPTGAIIREYSAFDVLYLERGVYRSRVWVFTDFNGGETPVSRRFKELTEALKDTEKLLRSANAAKQRLYSELDLERQQKLQAIKLQSDIVREVARARSKFNDESDEISSEQ